MTLLEASTDDGRHEVFGSWYMENFVGPFLKYALVGMTCIVAPATAAGVFGF